MKLAERLGIKCYDKELLELAAKESGFCEECLPHRMKSQLTVFFTL